MHLTQYAADRNCLVLYIPQSGEFIDREDAVFAGYILQKLEQDNPTWVEAFPNISLSREATDEVKISRAVRAVEELVTCTHVACMVAIDQWNVVRGARRGSLFDRLFGTFDRTRVARGVTYLAVSSSFVWPLGLFRDGDMITHRYTVTLYSQEELSAVASRMRVRKLLPAVGKGFDDEEIVAICGLVGRMLVVAQTVWLESGSDRWCKFLTKKFNDLAAGYC